MSHPGPAVGDLGRRQTSASWPAMDINHRRDERWGRTQRGPLGAEGGGAGTWSSLPRFEAGTKDRTSTANWYNIRDPFEPQELRLDPGDSLDAVGRDCHRDFKLLVRRRRRRAGQHRLGWAPGEKGTKSRGRWSSGDHSYGRRCLGHGQRRLKSGNRRASQGDCPRPPRGIEDCHISGAIRLGELDRARWRLVFVNVVRYGLIPAQAPSRWAGGAPLGPLGAGERARRTRSTADRREGPRRGEASWLGPRPRIRGRQARKSSKPRKQVSTQSPTFSQLCHGTRSIRTHQIGDSAEYYNISSRCSSNPEMTRRATGPGEEAGIVHDPPDLHVHGIRGTVRVDECPHDRGWDTGPRPRPARLQQDLTQGCTRGDRFHEAP